MRNTNIFWNTLHGIRIVLIPASQYRCPNVHIQSERVSEWVIERARRVCEISIICSIFLVSILFEYIDTQIKRIDTIFSDDKHTVLHSLLYSSQRFSKCARSFLFGFVFRIKILFFIIFIFSARIIIVCAVCFRFEAFVLEYRISVVSCCRIH